MSKQQDSWKEFEKLVTRVESALCPLGASVKHDDHVKDLRTGQTRQVDASIRYKLGSTPILITIECRERGSAEDVTWIEQLISKAQSIGAQKTIAVSSVGFSTPAQTLAAGSNVELRIVSNVTDSDIFGWLSFTHMDAVEYNYDVSQMRPDLKPDGQEGCPAMLPEDEKRWNEDRVDAPILFYKPTNRWTGPGHVLRQLSNKGTLYEGIPRDGEWHIRRMSIPAEADSLFINTTEGLKELVAVHLEIALRITHTRVPIEAYAYKSPSGGIVEAVESRINEQMVAGLYKDTTTGSWIPQIEFCKPSESKAADSDKV